MVAVAMAADKDCKLALAEHIKTYGVKGVLVRTTRSPRRQSSSRPFSTKRHMTSIVVPCRWFTAFGWSAALGIDHDISMGRHGSEICYFTIQMFAEGGRGLASYVQGGV